MVRIELLRSMGAQPKRLAQICCVAAVMGVVACASSPNPQPAPPAPEYSGLEASAGAGETASHDKTSISDVLVDRDGDVTTIQLQGVSDPIYTAFMQDDPNRVVLDISDVNAGTVAGEMAVYDGTIEDVSVTDMSSVGSGADRVRIEVTLAGDVDYDVEAFEDYFELRIWPSSTHADGEHPSDGVSTETAGHESGTAEALADELTFLRDPEQAAAHIGSEPATKLTSIEASSQSNGIVIEMWADGRIGEMEHFTLDDPNRLVVDLPGLQTALASDQIEVGTPEISKLRIGQHEDKIRVVIDTGESGNDFSDASFMHTAMGMAVVLGSPEYGQHEMWAWGSEPNFAGTETTNSVSEVANTWEDPTAAVDSITQPEGWENPNEQADHTEPFASSGEEIASEIEAASTELAEAGAAMVEDTEGASEAVVPTEEVDAWAETNAVPETAEMAEVAGYDEEPAEQVAEGSLEEASEADPVVPEAAEEIAETSKESNVGGVHVYGVQFDAQIERDRVVVLSDTAVRYDIFEPDPETFILRLVHADIDPEAAVRIAPEEVGAVSMVRAFQQPEADTPEVRIVVRRAAGVKPVINQQGTMLFLDFPRAKGLASAVPMLDEVPASEADPASKAMAQNEAELLPEPVPAALEPMEAIDILQEGGLIEGKGYTGRRVSLDFKDVEIADVLRLIAEVSDLNIIAGDEVQGEVTIRLVDVPWDQALDVILLTKGLGFIRVGNVLRIAPLDLLQAEEEARLQERRAKEKLEDLVVKLQPVNYASVDEVSGMVKRLLSPRGTVDVDKRTNTLILKDIPSVIAESTALIKAIDTQTPQVLIEAKIVEANLDFSREIGSTWAFGAQPLVDGFNADSGDRTDLGGEDFAFHDNALLTPFTDTFNHVSVSNPITSLATGLLDLGAFILDEKFNVELRLEAAESNGEGKVISSPRVVTLDNREATIEQGVSIPFQTFENGDAKLEFIDAVLKLEVTPHITADRSIIMEIEVQRNAPDDSVQTPTGSPAIAKNQAQTETLVKDGQTLVLGGIYVVRKAERESRVPYLHKIPLLGPAFKNSEVRDIRQELLVFVTPRIVVNPDLGS